jgi:hypothetical protein
VSWRGVPKKENYFPLFAEDWNALVDAVNDLYYMLQTLPPPPQAGLFVGGFLYGDIIPWLDLYYSLGDPAHRFLNVWAKNVYADPIWTSLLYASENVLVQGKPVLKDGDPISIYDVQDRAQGVLASLLQQYVTGPLSEYKEQVLSQLQQIQAALQNTNALINSHLARELYESYSYLLQFNYPSGVLQLLAPRMGYRTIVRGWYAISTGTSGVGRVMGSYSLTPVGLIPFSVPSLSLPDMWLGLYYDEPLLLYYDNVSLGAYLQLVLNIIQQWTGISIVYPSGVDPGPYMPPSGWKVFLNFVDPSEIQGPYWSWSDVSILQVEDGLLTMRGVAGGEGYVQYDNRGVAVTRGVVVFRVRDVTGDIPYEIVFLFLANGLKSVKFSLYGGKLNPDGTITTSIYDYWSYSTIKDNIILKQGEYYVLIYDFSDNTIRLLDASGNVIATANPTITSVDYGRFCTLFDLTNGVHTVDVDWWGGG